MEQVHAKFKVFAGKFSDSKDIDPLLGEIEKFAAEAKVASKSIGIEFLEKSGNVVMSLGYRDNEAHYPIKLSCVHIGKIDLSGDFSELENGMSEAASKQNNIICHELFITDADEFYMVFMALNE
ncbi:MAG: hypothetical protein GY749_09750 [Desulfobacteraceae bacterium]|nr:hypothetical protein [Desulfobacteraceae bacterium]